MDDLTVQAFHNWCAETGCDAVEHGPFYGQRAVYYHGNEPLTGTIMGLQRYKHAVYLWLDEPLCKRDVPRGHPEWLPVLLVNIYCDAFHLLTD